MFNVWLSEVLFCDNVIWMDFYSDTFYILLCSSIIYPTLLGRNWREMEEVGDDCKVIRKHRSLLPHAHLTQCSHTLFCYGFMSIKSLLSLSTHICSLPTQWKCKSYRKANFQFYCDLITNFTIKLRLSPLYLIIIWRYLNTFLPRALRYSRESIYGLSLSLFWL